MNPIPHTNTAPQSHRPTAAQVMRSAIVSEEVRRQERRAWLSGVIVNAVYVVIVVLFVVALSIN